MARELGTDTAKPSKTLEVKAETKKSDENELLSAWEHSMCHIMVGIAEFTTATGDRTCSTQSSSCVEKLPHRHVRYFIFTKDVTLRMVPRTAEPNLYAGLTVIGLAMW